METQDRDRMSGAEFYLLRRLMGLSQDNMAEILKMKRVSIRQYEIEKLEIPEGVEWEVEELIERHTQLVYEMQANVQNGSPIQVRRSDPWQVGVAMRVLDMEPNARVEWITD